MSEARPRDDGTEETIERRLPLRSDQVFEIVRREGIEEMRRPAASLAWSGLAAGLAIGFSVIAEAALAARLPADVAWSGLIADLGYTVGFIMVTMGRLQLFTENTITPVMPLCHEPTRYNLVCLARIWSIVLAANLVGATVFAHFAMQSGAFSSEIREGILALGHHALHGSFWGTVARGVGAGFLIASLVWMLAQAESGGVLIVFILTYVIAITGSAHVVAGTVEMTALVIDGSIGTWKAFMEYLLPAFLGNVIGGTALFTLIAYAQIQREID